MSGFSAKQLIMSLCCPFLCFLWGIIRFTVDITSGARAIICSGPCSCSAVLLGGILPAVLTLSLKVHTEDYLIKRLITIAVVYIINGFIGQIGVPVVMFTLYMLFGVGAVFFQIFKVQSDENSHLESAVLIISDPIVYWTIYWFVFWIFYL